MKPRFLIIALILLVVFVGCIFIWQMIYLPVEPGSDQQMVFPIKKGEGGKAIAIKLENYGLIKYGPIFRVYILFRGASKKLQAGDYSLSPGMNIPEIVNKIALGEVIKQKITIIEGWTLRDIGWYLEGEGITGAGEFFKVVGFPMTDYSEADDLIEPKDFSQEFDFLEDKPKNIGLEGYLFPDTYEIVSGATNEEIARKILANFDKKLTPDLRKEISRQKKSIFEIVTMASLIEKEVRTIEDKKLVSGIFWERLKIGKPLESCASIAYILGVNKWRYSFDDTRIKSPYNTYLNRGLPLGPISNPGMESILAAIYPEESDYWYYLSTPEGKTIFSRTLEEHNIAKGKYLK